MTLHHDFPSSFTSSIHHAVNGILFTLKAFKYPLHLKKKKKKKKEKKKLK